MSAALDVRSPHPTVLKDVPLRVDRDEVLRFQGYKKDVDVPSAQVLAIFEEALALGRSLLTPRVVYRAIAVTGGGADRIDAGGEPLHIPQIARLWGPIEAVGAGRAYMPLQLLHRLWRDAMHALLEFGECRLDRKGDFPRTPSSRRRSVS